MQADLAQEGYCSVYFHLPQDTKALIVQESTDTCKSRCMGCQVRRTLFVGRQRHGPVEAESLTNIGVSEMCAACLQRLSDCRLVVSFVLHGPLSAHINPT